MNTPPSATRFRIRKIVVPSRSTAGGAAAGAGDLPFAPAPEDDGFGDLNLVRDTSPAPGAA